MLFLVPLVVSSTTYGVSTSMLRNSEFKQLARGLMKSDTCTKWLLQRNASIHYNKTTQVWLPENPGWPGCPGGMSGGFMCSMPFEQLIAPQPQTLQKVCMQAGQTHRPPT